MPFLRRRGLIVPRISFKAIAIAFTAELGADLIIRQLFFYWFAQGMITPDMNDAELQKVGQAVIDTTAYVPCMFVLGTATTVLGGYLAARLAKRIPYYHGLAMGIAGILFSLVLWSRDARWYDYLGLLITIPASLYGAHLARRHMPSEP
jgi:hypothetical protein